MLKPKRIAILGSTGSIGTQVLDIISRYPGRFRPEVLTCKSSADLLIEQARRYKPARVVIANKSLYARVKDGLKDLPVEVMAGNEELEYAATLDEIDMVVAAMVGYAGMKPVLAAVKAGKNIALANKETLVVAGELIGELTASYHASILPVDSEHSAIFQC
ncbi:MAG TPA: 1-deoxy-D-xylulose-5-phosphate reductoisomerase, partial [Bacteroidales bacterium]|nr:1-deoxy-D-xylulose-5-phosphate reductoisomerase [Bacteroidales bacterium]